MTTNCTNCGTTIPAGARFCPNCGTAIVAAPPPGSDADTGYTRLYGEDGPSAPPPARPPVTPAAITPPVATPPASAPAAPPPVNPAPPPIVTPGAQTPPPPPPTSYRPDYAQPEPTPAVSPYQAGPNPTSPYQAAPNQSPPYQASPYQQPPGSPPPYAPPPEEPAGGSRLPWIIGGVALIALSGAAIYGFSRDGSSLKPIDDKVLAEQSSEGEGAAAPETKVIKPAENLFVAAEANVRDKPTTTGSTVVGKMPRGASVNGDVVAGAKGDQWLKVAGKEEYISLINLTQTALPPLVSTANTDATIRATCGVMTRPSSGAPVKVTLKPGAKVKISGFTEGDFAEFALPKGGVGYVEDGGRACLTAPEVAPVPTGSSGDFEPPSDEGERIFTNDDG